MSKITITGIDLAKSVFHLHAADSTGRQVKAIKLSSSQALTLSRSQALTLETDRVFTSQRTYYGCNGGLCQCPSLGQVMPVAGP